ncbi:hypothetical protein F2Q68_00028764 [Brassica cretica]|uniref:TRAM domain-containing protein n=1 Tax=Brassica cretica TaxID=69181 RepID=A0A8S9GCU3_BRACR|nr:hypothetical protein F2Q68_00028764 [Brassica cretica]
MASSSLSSLSSILSNPQGCSLCFKASTRRGLSLAFLSSKLNHSSSSSALLPRCYRLTQNSIKRKKGFALDLSRSFSVSQTKFDGPSLHQFISKAQTSLTAPQTESECTTQDSDIASPSKGRIYHETYGCQMNINDMEIVLSIMNNSGYKEVVTDPESAEVIFINTCAIRDNAEQRVWQRLNYFWFLKRQWKANVAEGRAKSTKPPKVVVLGCMAERLKDKILDSDKMVDVVCGPDAYRDLPRLLEEVDYGQKGINTLLSLEETYAELIEAFRETTGPCYDSQVGSVQLVLVEGPNKRAPETELIGKTDKGHRVSFVRKPLFDKDKGHGDMKRSPEVGDFVEVKIERSTRASLYGEALAISKMSLFHDVGGVDAVVASCANDVPAEVKQRRLTELIEAFRETTGPCYDSQVGSVQLVLVEGPNKRAPETELIGKTDKGHRVSFVRKPLFDKDKGHGDMKRSPEVGDFVEVKIERSTRASLYGEALAISKMSLFHDVGGVDAVVASCAS